MAQLWRNAADHWSVVKSRLDRVAMFVYLLFGIGCLHRLERSNPNIVRSVPGEKGRPELIALLLNTTIFSCVKVMVCSRKHASSLDIVNSGRPRSEGDDGRKGRCDVAHFYVEHHFSILYILAFAC